MFYIAQKNWDKILGYAEEAYSTEKSEIGGMSVMVEDKDGDWILEDPVILKQEISAGNTVLDKDALADYYTKQAMKMKKKNFRFCWWHSHHTMGAFWSGTDKIAIDEFDEGDFSFALVVNLKGEYKFRVSVWKPLAVHEDTELEILDRKSRCTKKMTEEVKELCSKPTTYVKSWKKQDYGYSYGGYGYRSADQLAARTDPRQETLFNGVPHINDIGTGKQGFTDIVETVDDANSELIDGTLTFKDYTNVIDALNTALEKEKSMYKITLIKETDIGNLMHILPAQLVVYAASGEVVNEMYNDGFDWMGY